ncbi:hypothetical protein IIY67_02510 [Candidatus Saccharibacteria bacterium]|nr:hypothetical protein [Candidatus Saccharibacteria bacterium]
MMDTSTKYRRWGWGAVIGLIAVILLAGLVVALSMGKKPKVADTKLNADTNSGTVAVEDGASQDQQNGETVNGGTTKKDESETKTESENKAEDEKNTNNSSANKQNSDSGTTAETEKNTKRDNAVAGNSGEMPKTGPVDATMAIVAVAVSAYLLSLNVAWAREDARK